MEKLNQVISNISQVIIGKDAVIRSLLAGVLSGGHILIEDVPGVGKTTLALALARSVGCTFARIQFTPDLLPADITGLTIPDREGDFRFRPGPIMNQIVLADEINRASPRTQSSLLEAMAERQVSVDGTTYPLPHPFVVLATQNPIEYEGTYPLPEAQLDRFMLRLSIGYPDAAEERRIVRLIDPAQQAALLEPVMTAAELIECQKMAENLYVADAIDNYIVDLIQASREHRDILLGISPRGGQHIHRAARSYALLAGRDHVLPDDVKAVFVPASAHRLMLRPEALLRGLTADSILADILKQTRVPVLRHGR